MTFDALETIERNSDSMDKLTSLVSKMNMMVEEIVIGKEQSKDLDQFQGLVQIVIRLGVIDVENMIILQGNVPVLSQMKIQIIVTWIR